MCFIGLYYTSGRQRTSEDRTVDFISDRPLCPYCSQIRTCPQKKFIDVGAGVVDSDYHGEVGVVLFNHGNQDFEVKMGDRIAQLILEKIDTPPVKEVQDLDNTVRGSGGFGSTGVKSGNDTGSNSEKKNENGQNERTGEKKQSMVKNETLKGRMSGSRTRTEKKKTTEGSSRLSRE